MQITDTCFRVLLKPALIRAGFCAGLYGFSAAVQAAGWVPLGGGTPAAAGLGVAYAGTAVRVDDASVVAANPAGMSYLGQAGQPGVVSLGGQVDAARFEPSVSGVSSNDVRDPTTVSYLYLGYRMTDRWSAGLAVTQPYAFDAHYGASWPGGASQLKVSSQRVNPAVAYRVSEALSIGGGISYQTLKLESLASTTYRSEDVAPGWNLGGIYELVPTMRLGLAYRSPVHHHLSGGLDLDTPESLTFSVWQQYSDRWEASGEIARYRLSSLQGSASTVQQAAFAHQGGWRAAWGATYRHDDRRKSRFGIAVERNPADGSNLAAHLSEDHAVWLTMGVQYKLTAADVLDVGLALRWPSRADVDGAAGVQGEYRISGYVASVQYSRMY